MGGGPPGGQGGGSRITTGGDSVTPRANSVRKRTNSAARTSGSLSNSFNTARTGSGVSEAVVVGDDVLVVGRAALALVVEEGELTCPTMNPPAAEANTRRPMALRRSHTRPMMPQRIAPVREAGLATCMSQPAVWASHRSLRRSSTMFSRRSGRIRSIASAMSAAA